MPAGEAAAETPRWSESGGHVSEARVVVRVVLFHRQQPFAAGLAWRGLPRWPSVRLGCPPLPAHHREQPKQDQVRGQQAETEIQC